MAPTGFYPISLNSFLGPDGTINYGVVWQKGAFGWQLNFGLTDVQFDQTYASLRSSGYRLICICECDDPQVVANPGAVTADLIAQKYAQMHGPDGILGNPASSVMPLSERHFQIYGNGAIYARSIGVIEIDDIFWRKWISLGSERSPLGYPVTDTMDAIKGLSQRFERGVMYSSLDTQNIVMVLGTLGAKTFSGTYFSRAGTTFTQQCAEIVVGVFTATGCSGEGGSSWSIQVGNIELGSDGVSITVGATEATPEGGGMASGSINLGTFEVEFCDGTAFGAEINTPVGGLGADISDQTCVTYPISGPTPTPDATPTPPTPTPTPDDGDGQLISDSGIDEEGNGEDDEGDG